MRNTLQVSNFNRITTFRIKEIYDIGLFYLGTYTLNFKEEQRCGMELYTTHFNRQICFLDKVCFSVGSIS